MFSIKILISTIRKNTDQKKDMLLKSLEDEWVKVIYSHSHCKIIACRTELNNYYVIDGSGNFTTNARIEQYSFENNRKLYEFHKQRIDELEVEENLNNKRKKC
jgi:hypothetical protein